MPHRSNLKGESPVDAIEQLETILPALDEIAGQVPLDELDNRTPCDKFRVRDLFDHMIGGASQFAPQLWGHPGGSAPDPATLRDDERPVALKRSLADLLAATKAPGALGRTVTLPFGEVPGQVLVRFLTVDGMVHTWDIAQATGQRYEPPEELARAVLATARDLIAPEMRDGDTFATQVPVADTAPAITQLVAFTGRAV